MSEHCENTMGIAEKQQLDAASVKVMDQATKQKMLDAEVNAKTTWNAYPAGFSYYAMAGTAHPLASVCVIC